MANSAGFPDRPFQIRLSSSGNDLVRIAGVLRCEGEAVAHLYFSTS